MWTCVYADVAMGKMRRKMWINIRILPAHAPSVSGILQPLTFECLHDICSCSSGLHDFLHREKLLLDFHGRCSRCSYGFSTFARTS